MSGPRRLSTGIDRRQAEGKRADRDVCNPGADEPGGDVPGLGENADGLDEVAVGPLRSRDQPRDREHQPAGIAVVKRSQRAAAGHGELETGEAPARLEDAADLAEAPVEIDQVAEAEADG